MQRSLPITAVNGVIDAQISPLDRGFNYGDGVFETCKLTGAKIPLWDLHKERLLNGCKKLSIPVEPDLIDAQLANMIAVINEEDRHNAVVKITVTRGSGGRGYRTPDAVTPTIVMSIFPAPIYPLENFSDGVVAKVCDLRLSCSSSLAGLKHLNRLEQVLARSEWQDESIAEGLLFDTQHHLIEAVFSNIFLISNGQLLTPDLSQAGVAGVMRRFIIETLAPQAGLIVDIKALNQTDLFNADAVFLCNSLYGIWHVKKILADQIHVFKPHAVTLGLQSALCEALAAPQC